MTPATALADFIATHHRLLILTGAGISTASGIPDYRDENGDWKHARPVMYQDFIETREARQRYWSRSMLGWPRMQMSEPNVAHHALKDLEARGCTTAIVTQNVDGLHQKSGAKSVIDLHGRLDGVTCLQCGWSESRAAWQDRLSHVNAAFQEQVIALNPAPDGDASFDIAANVDFELIDCPTCEGIVKPDVVFFGESVPKYRIDKSLSALAAANALLVCGSSLVVYSGFRFAREAARLGRPIALLNFGFNRAADLATLNLNADCGPTLAETLELLR